MAGETNPKTPGQCKACVLEVIERLSHRKPELDDLLSDLFVPCNPDVLHRLADALRECTNVTPDLDCGKSVRRIINELCG